ncbi:MAG: alpha/beta hydrolase [Asticcacaulis sp.]
MMAAAALVLLGASGCSKLKEAAGLQGGQAFLDSRIPPGLSPQYFPPEGFVWGAYRAGNLPEARYGVASPPVNPRAQVLILADADYPAETYFELARQLLGAGYGVWLLDVPGQGGAGHYLLQGDAVFTRSFHDSQTTAADFIRDIVHPTPDKPLFVLGTGYSAINALSLSTMLKSDAMAGFIAFDPYAGGEIDKGKAWHSEDVPAGYWGGIAQSWQMSNPDLRLRVKSEQWRAQVKKAYAELNGLHLPVMSLKGRTAGVLVIEPKAETTATANAASALCAHLPHCRMEANDGPQALGASVGDFITTELPATD